MENKRTKKLKAMKKFNVDGILIIILLVAAVLRFYNLGFQEPWLDELSSLQVSDPELTFAETHTLIMTREGFPHFYFLSLKFLSGIFGHSIYVLRFLSAVVGLASVYVMYLFGKELINKRTGYIAAILVTVNFFHIFHSQEGRSYALMFFFVVLASYRMVKYVKVPTFANAILLGISCGLIPNAHPIGVLNTAVIYATLFVFLMMEKDKKKIFIQLLVAGFFTLLVFSPVYQIISKVSEISSFWIPAASFETIRQSFFELLGSLTVGLYCYILSVLAFLVIIIFKIKKNQDADSKKLQIMALSLVLFWILINIGVIVVKSYVGISIILSRYFIGSLCMFILTFSYCIGLVKNKYIRFSVIALFVLISLNYIYENKYYTSVRKAQWSSLAKEISAKNVNEDRIYGAYGFTSNILFKNSPSYTLMQERTLEDYIKMVQNKAVEPESFWYFDGNFRPYSLSIEDEKYLQDNYILDIQIDKFDCWARHYILKGFDKTEEGESVFVSSFNPKVLDDQGRLYIFNNETISTKNIYFKPGKYEFLLEATSLPENKINNESAHIFLSLNDKKIGEDFLDEESSKRHKKYIFDVVDTKPYKLSITFDNDFAEGKLDRNVLIYSIKINRIED